MNRITLIIITMFTFAACERTEIPDIDNGPTSADDKHWAYQVSMTVTDLPVYNGYTIQSSINMDNLSYPDSSWTVTMHDFFNTGVNNPYTFTVETDGNFSFDFEHESVVGSYFDHVTGSGYFDADTLYFSYTYEEAESGNSGYVEVWSH